MRLVLLACTALFGWQAIACAAEPSSPPATDVQGTGALSDKLSNTGGVIHPKTDVDPDIKRTPPAAGTTMPVIPPPGAPGGDPNVTPK